jgi:hypothetical protein
MHKFLFLLDRSDLMDDKKVKNPKEALFLFIKSLPKNKCFKCRQLWVKKPASITKMFAKEIF